MQKKRRIVLFYSCYPSDDILRDKLARLLRPLVRMWLENQKYRTIYETGVHLFSCKEEIS